MGITTIFAILICVLLHFSASGNVECPSEGIAYIPHHDCKIFIICSNGQAAEMKCPHCLYYNPETTQCDFPENVLGCNGETRPPTTNATSTTTQEPTTTVPPPPGALTQCGQTLFADNGTIQYKLNERYDAGELCVFVVRFETGRINSTFVLESDGISSLDENAVRVFRFDPYISTKSYNLGNIERNVTFVSWGAVIIFKTNSNMGTGFKLSFMPENIVLAEPSNGKDFVFNNEIQSPFLYHLANTTGGWNNIIFTSDSKQIVEQGTNFKLTVTVDLANGPSTCANMFHIYTFEEEELIKQKMICFENEDRIPFEFTTRGLFFVNQLHYPDRPIKSAVLEWEVVPMT